MKSTYLSRLNTAIKEAITIVIAAILLGFSYTFIMKRGLFLPAEVHAAKPAKVVPPEFISYEEAVMLYTDGLAFFVDARHEFDFKLGHIKGAINFPLKDFTPHVMPLANIPKDRLIVTYCDGEDCNSSIQLAEKLSEAGFTQVRIFFGGWNEWQKHHLQIESNSSR